MEALEGSKQLAVDQSRVSGSPTRIWSVDSAMRSTPARLAREPRRVRCSCTLRPVSVAMDALSPARVAGLADPHRMSPAYPGSAH
jgi:hypothetical protein